MRGVTFHLVAAGVLLLANSAATTAKDLTVPLTVLAPEAALRLAQGALESCRGRGFQVAVAVVDRFGVPQAMLRDRFAGPHTPATATAKAYTAVSFRTSTVELVERTQPGSPAAAIRGLPGVAVIGGGVVVEARGNILGGIGVSGAPGGREDEDCANVALAAIKEDLEFQ